MFGRATFTLKPIYPSHPHAGSDGGDTGAVFISQLGTAHDLCDTGSTSPVSHNSLV